MKKLCAVYFMSNKKNGTIYTGSTNNLHRRIEEHKSLGADSFTKKYSLTHCVYVEICPNLETALILERRYKKYLRQWKINLIEKINPDWKDLSEQFNIILPY